MTGFIKDYVAPQGSATLPNYLAPEPVAQPDAPDMGMWGAYFLKENELGAAAGSYHFDPSEPIDPDFHPWQQIQGTKYEPYASAFVGAQSAADMEKARQWVDTQITADGVIAASGWAGVFPMLAASILSPTSFLPGGAVVKGAKGINIMKTAFSVGLNAAEGTAIQEGLLHATQPTRTMETSAVAIGSGLILGGLLGAGVGKFATKGEFAAAAGKVEGAVNHLGLATDVKAKAEQGDLGTLEADVLNWAQSDAQSLSAASNPNPTFDATTSFDLKGNFGSMIDKVPFLRGLVRASPEMRAHLSPNVSSKAAMNSLVDSTMQLKGHADGFTMQPMGGSVENRVRYAMNQDVAGLISNFQNHFAEYWKDGPAGSLGTFTAPVSARWNHLLGMTGKMDQSAFMEEVGTALDSGDRHPIPQVQSAVDDGRRFYEKWGKEAVDVGMFSSLPEVKNAPSYFTHVYQANKIIRDFKDAQGRSFEAMLAENFTKKRDRAQMDLAFDPMHTQVSNDVARAKETVTQGNAVLRSATQRALDKAGRAKSAIGRETAVGRVTGALRANFEARAQGLTGDFPNDAGLEAFKSQIADVRGLKRLEPQSLLGAIRDMGGIKDPRSGGMWNGVKGWTKNQPATELENLLGRAATGIRRNDGQSLDDVRSMLEQLGFLPEGSTQSDLMEAIRKEAAGEKIYSAQTPPEELARYQAAQELEVALSQEGIDYTKPFKEIVDQLHNSSPVKRAKAGEAMRSAGKAGEKELAAESKITKAMDRLEQAKARLDELDADVGPKIRAEIAAAQQELKTLIPRLRDLTKQRGEWEKYAALTPEDILAAAKDVKQKIIGLGPGHHAAEIGIADPLHARMLDVPADETRPWRETNAQIVMSHYAHSVIPQIEMTRVFGDINAKDAIKAIADEGDRLWNEAKTPKAKAAVIQETKNRIVDFEGVRDHMLGRGAQHANPAMNWLVGARKVATGSAYMGYLGMSIFAQIPDIAGIIGKSGVEAFGLPFTALTDPKRLFKSAKDAMDFGSAAEWSLNTRAMSMGEMFDPHGEGSAVERVMGQAQRTFTIASGILPWTVTAKTAAVMATASKASKAIMRVAAGKATKKEVLTLAAGGIDAPMARQIADQLSKHGDFNGFTVLPQGAKWTDLEARDAFGRMMSREMDNAIITPGAADTPLFFSSEAGKFFGQFKKFAFASHQRILLAGLQRADGAALAQFTSAIILGALVSNAKAWFGGYEPKTGAALWEDAVDKSGIAGYLMEPYGAAARMSGGATSLSGQTPSRFATRAPLASLFGPSMDMVGSFAGGIGAASSALRGNSKFLPSDADKLMRPIPGNNLWITKLLGLDNMVETAIVNAFGGTPRP